jgi:coatomer subunit beta
MMIISSNIQTNISVAQPSVFSKGAELLELLVPICRCCLEHHHSYIRKNTVFAVYTVYREFENLIPTLADLLSGGVRLQVEHILFLAHCAMPKAVMGY